MSNAAVNLNQKAPSLEVEVMPKHFGAGKSKVVEAVMVANCIISKQLDDRGIVRVNVHGVDGRPIDVTLDSLALKAHDLFNPAYDNLAIVEGAYRYTEQLQNALQRIGFQGKIDTVQQMLKEAYPGNATVKKGDLNGNQSPIYSTSAALKRSQDGNIFAFLGKNSISVYQTVNTSTGKILPPSQWQHEVIDRSKINDEMLKSKPYLREFLDTQAGHIIKNTTTAVTHRSGMLLFTDTKSGENFFSEPSAGYQEGVAASGFSFQNRIFSFNPKTNSLEVIDPGSRSPVKVQRYEIDLKGGKAIDFTMDPGRNFLLVVEEREVKQESKEKSLFLDVDHDEELLITDDDLDFGFGDSPTFKPVVQVKRNLKIFDAHSHTLLDQVSDVHKVCGVDAAGNVYYVDENDQLGLVSTNFETFGAGGVEEAVVSQAEQYDEMLSRLKDVRLPDVDLATSTSKSNPKPSNKIEAIKAAQDIVFDRLSTPIEKANTLEELQKVEAQLRALKDSPDYFDLPEVFQPIDKLLATKVQAARLVIFREDLEELDTIAKKCAKSNTPDNVLNLAHKVRELKSVRSDLFLPRDEREEIHDSLSDYENQLNELKSELVEELTPKLEEDLKRIKRVLDIVQSPEELRDIYSEPEVEDFNKRVRFLLEPDQRSIWRDQFRALYKAKAVELSTSSMEGVAEERDEVAHLILDLRSLHDDIAKEVAGVTSQDELDRLLARNSLVSTYHQLLQDLPVEYQDSERSQFEEMLGSARSHLESQARLKETSNDGRTVKFNNVEFPKFNLGSPVWEVKVVPNPNLTNPSEGTLTFIDNLGRKFTPAHDPVSLGITNTDLRALENEYRDEALGHFESLERKVPKFQPIWSLNDFTMGYLDQIAEYAMEQISNSKEGIILLMGEAGSGKNVLLEIFACLTNYEVYEFSCKKFTTKDDVFYTPEYHPVRGTYNEDSELVRRCQMPGQIIILDEMPALQPEVAKTFNSLGDWRRKLILPDGREIPLHPTNIIAATGNLASYLGSGKLPADIQDRSDTIEVPYMPFDKGNGTYYSYEAEILRKKFDDFKGFKQKEFELLWDYYINGNKTNGGDRFLRSGMEHGLDKIKKLLEIASKVRERNEQTKLGELPNGLSPLKFPFSMRRTTRIAGKLNRKDNVVKLVKENTLPGFHSATERKTMEAIIDS